MEIINLLNNDYRFSIPGSPIQSFALKLNNSLSDSSVLEIIHSDKNYKLIEYLGYVLNYAQYCYKNGNFFDLSYIDVSTLLACVEENFLDNWIDNVEISIEDLKYVLEDDYVDPKRLYFDTSITTTKKSEFLTDLLKNKSSDSSFPSKNVSTDVSIKNDLDYWVQALNLFHPIMPQPDINDIRYSAVIDGREYCIYGDAVVPWAQCQITAVSDISKFSTSDILNLFPDIRVYTRSQYLYQKYDNTEYDEDLGTVFKISGYTKSQIIKNIIEYPHLEGLDRIVKVKGVETLLPFWKHIELNGEIYPTTSVWSELPDTKNLPKTESFMNEYVVRKYILDSNNGVEHKYKMRGSLKPFLTLYANPAYYEKYGYDPLEIGKKCIEARRSFAFTRNPILKKLDVEEPYA